MNYFFFYSFSIDIPRQTPSPQTLLLQSECPRQFNPLSHGVHIPPPQSLSVSFPLTVLSLQVGAKIQDEFFFSIIF